jgi:hypothetical protein
MEKARFHHWHRLNDCLPVLENLSLQARRLSLSDASKRQLDEQRSKGDDRGVELVLYRELR